MTNTVAALAVPGPIMPGLPPPPAGTPSQRVLTGWGELHRWRGSNHSGTTRVLGNEFSST
ncbi:hypothetical protein BO86DRAFT_393143 [Aspergillus japonicus CBS 114.51]|uniref:Uncharacterized protein n=1 Tax=Aspergillus japonicus CBS 114.51 TaxID=1448312 RepID=A0A8T8WM26_ASPJA|nr:hypothetical protein BO86DRAFT_393143 [Aspergillus japonicus CBS 114.51]RAH76826.1 hypothetical protein BO86DRAFT_393143 [Aspergillus japonicus CBS 114.51]